MAHLEIYTSRNQGLTVQLHNREWRARGCFQRTMELILAIESSTESEEERCLKRGVSRVRQSWLEDGQGRQGLVTGRLPILLGAGSQEKPRFKPIGADDTYFYCEFNPNDREHPEHCENRAWRRWEREYHQESHVEAEYVIEFGWAWDWFWHSRKDWLEVNQHKFWAVWTQVKGWYEAGIAAPGLNNEWY